MCVRVFTLHSLAELIVLGTGSQVGVVPQPVKRYLSEHKISLEVQDTVRPATAPVSLHYQL